MIKSDSSLGLKDGLIWTVNFLMFKLVLEKAEEPEIKLPTSAGSWKKQEGSRKTSPSALLTMPKPLTVWLTTKYGKLFKRWEYQTTWPASWEICMQIKKQHLEPICCSMFRVFSKSQFFTSGGQNIGASVSASVFPMTIQDWFPLGLTGLISLQSKGLSKSLLQHHSSKASILRHSAFFMVQLSHPYMTTGKTIALTRQTFVGKLISLLFNMLNKTLNMEQQTGSKLGKEYVKAVYGHSAYLTSMQSTSCEMLGWMKHKLESRLQGEISTTSDMYMTPL